MSLQYIVFLVLPFLVAILAIRGTVEVLITSRPPLGTWSVRAVIVDYLVPRTFLGEINILYMYSLSVLISMSTLLLVNDAYGSSSFVLQYYILFFILVAAAVTDAYTGTLSDLLIKISYTLVPLALFEGYKSFLLHVLFALIVFGILWLANRFNLIGGGDVEILVVISFFLSKDEFFTSLLLSSGIGLVLVGVRYLVLGVIEKIPFIPALLMGVAFTLFARVSLFSYYFNT